MTQNQLIMLRTLITIGMIMGFIAIAFVPPTDANFRAAEGLAQAQVGARTVTVTAMQMKKTSAYWKQVKKESDDKDLVSRMADIEWATRKQDVRLCIAVYDTAAARGDYLALCLAKVTGDPARCDQIDFSAPVLRKLCTEELAT